MNDLEALCHERKLEGYFPMYPCHTQAVERTVKLVTEASVSVIDASGRDGSIRNTISSRSKMSKFGSKRDFTLLGIRLVQVQRCQSLNQSVILPCSLLYFVRCGRFSVWRGYFFVKI